MNEVKTSTITKAANLKLPGFEYQDNKYWKENFFFIQAADTQFGLIEDWGKVPLDKQKWDEDIKLTKLAITHANNLTPRPKFFIICGDMINAGFYLLHLVHNVASQ